MRTGRRKKYEGRRVPALLQPSPAHVQRDVLFPVLRVCVRESQATWSMPPKPHDLTTKTIRAKWDRLPLFPHCLCQESYCGKSSSLCYGMAGLGDGRSRSVTVTVTLNDMCINLSCTCYGCHGWNYNSILIATFNSIGSMIHSPVKSPLNSLFNVMQVVTSCLHSTSGRWLDTVLDIQSMLVVLEHL